MKRTAVFLALGLVALGAAQVRSEENFGSLVPRTGFVNPLSSRTACKVGDLVTIIINETATASLNGSTTTTKSDANSSGPNSLGFIDTLLNKFRLPDLKAILGDNSTAAKSSVAGTGTTTASNKFNTRLTVMVREVLPNGNLMLEGQRWMKINKEDHNIVFSGVVRADDVRRDNSVLSESVANPKLDIVGKGTVADRQRKGFLTKVLDWLF